MFKRSKSISKRSISEPKLAESNLKDASSFIDLSPASKIEVDDASFFSNSNRKLSFSSSKNRDRERAVLKKLKPANNLPWPEWNPDGMSGHADQDNQAVTHTMERIGSMKKQSILISPSKERNRSESNGYHRPSNYEPLDELHLIKDGNNSTLGENGLGMEMGGFKPMRSESLDSILGISTSVEETMVEVPLEKETKMEPTTYNHLPTSESVCSKSVSSKSVSIASPARTVYELAPESTKPFLSTFSAYPPSSTNRRPSVDEQLSNISNNSSKVRTTLLESRNTGATKYSTNFNILVIGAKSTGKTTLIKTVIETQESLGGDTASLFGINPRTGKILKTQSDENVVSLAILKQQEKFKITIRDSIGLELGNDSTLELQVNKILKEIEARLENSLLVESQVERQKNKSDERFHLVLYFIHPDSIQPITPTVKPSPITHTPESLQEPPLPALASTSTSLTRKSSILRDQKLEMENYRFNQNQNPLPSNPSISKYPPSISQTTTSSSPRIDPESIHPLSPVPPSIDLASTTTSTRNRSNSINTKKPISIRPILNRLGSVETEVIRKMSIEALEGEDDLCMSKDDLSILTRLNELVTALPILGMSDRLTTEELKRYQFFINRDLKILDLSLFETIKADELDSNNISTELEEPTKLIKLSRSRSRSNSIAKSHKSRKSISNLKTLEDLNVPIINSLPLLMIGAEFGHGITTLSRNFKYGSVNILDPTQTDFELLKNVIFCPHWIKLILEENKGHYERFRTRRLSSKEL